MNTDVQTVLAEMLAENNDVTAATVESFVVFQINQLVDFIDRTEGKIPIMMLTALVAQRAIADGLDWETIAEAINNEGAEK